MFVDKELLREINEEESRMSLADKWFFAAEVFTIASFILSLWGILL